MVEDWARMGIHRTNTTSSRFGFHFLIFSRTVSLSFFIFRNFYHLTCFNGMLSMVVEGEH